MMQRCANLLMIISFTCLTCYSSKLGCIHIISYLKVDLRYPAPSSEFTFDY